MPASFSSKVSGGKLGEENNCGKIKFALMVRVQKAHWCAKFIWHLYKIY